MYVKRYYGNGEKLMKLRRIIAGVTACTVVASTMLVMPVSAKTTTKAEKVTLMDLLNSAKMVVQLTDDIKAEKQAELLDKFDTNGNGKISIDEVLSIARRIARTDESDIVNEHGTADSEETTTAETTLTEDTTTTAETTAVETTETTEETTTTTEAVVFAPVVKIGGTEYKDGDKFIAETGGIYSVEVTDAENEITFSLTGSKDNEDNNLVRVSGSNFEVLANGTLTVTVKASDGREKTITLNVVTEKHIEGLTDFYIGFSCSDSDISDEYYENILEGYKLYFENGIISEEDFNDVKLQLEIQNKFGDIFSVSSIMEIPYVGDEIQITNFLKLNEDNTVEPYGITDKVTYKSSDESKVYASEDGKIVAKGVTTEPVEILMFVDGKVVNRFKVTVEKEQSERILTDTSARIIADDNFGVAVESKYIDGVNSGIVLSLNELKSAVGEENVNYISYRKADGTNLKFIDNFDAEQFAKDNGLLMFIDESNATIYYAMTNPEGYINTQIPLNDNNGTLFEQHLEILDMEQFREYYNSLGKSEALTVNIKGVTATAKDSTEMTADKTVYLTEGETLSLSDIVKVSGVESPKITVKNLEYDEDTGTCIELTDEQKNIDYDPLTQTFTARGVKVLGSGRTGISTVSFTYKATDGTTRTVNVKIQIVKPVAFLKENEYEKIGYIETYEDLNGEKIYIPKTANISDIGDFVKAIPAVVNTFDEDGGIYQGSRKESEIYKFVVNEPSDWSFSVDNKKMLNVKLGSYEDTISWADGYSLSEAKAGDTVTVTAKHKQGFEVSYTLVIADTLPQVSKSGIGTDTFKYPSDNKGNQFITFDNIVDVTNLPEDWKVVPYVWEASDNVKYEDVFDTGETLNEQGTVDATGIKLVKGSNGHYSVSGIEVATASKVEQETYINIMVAVFDKAGNTIGGLFEPIKLSINGEKGKNDVLSMTINGITKSVSADETADFGKIYVPENASVTYSATGTGVFAQPAPSVTNSKCDEFTVADGKITAKALNKNGESKTVTFTFGKGSYQRTATAEIVVVKPVAVAPAYTSDGNIDVTGVTYYSVGNNVAQPALVTKTDENDKPDLNSGLVTGGFTLGKTTNNTKTYTLQGISIDVTNKAVKNLPTVTFKNTSVTVDTSAKEAVFEDAFDIPSGDFTVEFISTGTGVSYNQTTNSVTVTIGGGIYDGKMQFLVYLRLKDANGNIISYSDDTFEVNFIDTINVKMAKPSSGQFRIEIPYTDEIADNAELKATDFEEAPSGITINEKGLSYGTDEKGNIVVDGFWTDATVADGAVLKFKLTVDDVTKNIEVTFFG